MRKIAEARVMNLTRVQSEEEKCDKKGKETVYTAFRFQT
jgi:hypothetical protein